MSVANSTLPEPDATLVAEAYNALPEKIPNFDAARIVNGIAWRIFVEFCTEAMQGGDTPEAQTKRHTYDGAAYREWRDAEVHFALEREGGEVDQVRYEAMRKRIMKAIVARAVELFRDWGTYDGPTYANRANDQRNLRTKDLREYLPAA